MIPKPKHLGGEYTAQFKDHSVVQAYRYRPPYPPETFEILCTLLTEEPRVVLDIGCGTGAIARHLIAFVERIDAVDFSPEMIQRAKYLPYGDHPHLHWICGPVEDAPLSPPYTLITAGASLHWMEWKHRFPAFSLTPHTRRIPCHYRESYRASCMESDIERDHCSLFHESGLSALQSG
jgi:SAM-dependent methyltransferase